MLSSLIGAAIGSAIDGAEGDDSTVDGAIGGAIAGFAVRAITPIVLTYATGWLVLRGFGKAKDAIFSGRKTS
ncbi:hypothetical protein ACT009_14900 [Sphingomonas sp. Tas61C01]|uniref:hypothetical protein n=1 Tax=Sphingomonas sp. Tas61C01 TaxID=3458297 RepID=UPI00403E9C0A